MNSEGFFAALGVLMLSALVASACSSSDSATGDETPAGAAGTPSNVSGAAGQGGSADVAAGAGGTPANAGNAGAPANGGGGALNQPSSCVRTCNVAPDCAKPSSNPPVDENNWVCEAHRCRWLGCLSDDECAFFGGVCREGGTGSGTRKACTEACTEADVCAETLASVDIDNWSCIEGGCKYTGCLSDDECVRDFGAGSKCVSNPDRAPSCARACAKPSDCVTQGTAITYDEDNWQCKDGLCVYAGCLSDAECTTAEGLPSVCVP